LNYIKLSIDLETNRKRGDFMKKKIAKLMAVVAMTMGLVSCTGGSGSGGTYYDCIDYYDYWGYYLYTECGYYYYNTDGTQSFELDMVAQVADQEAFALEKTASIYAEKFSLSTDKAMQIAKNIKDLNALEDRSAADLADFAQKLYGVNPSEVVDAVANAQVGNNAELDAVISTAAENFNTDTETMKAIVKELHGQALEANGIEL
tara:strand:+ start:260706 stop:261317 length:612 start_codon:yes stop_codon:yes gene_type:complete